MKIQRMAAMALMVMQLTLTSGCGGEPGVTLSFGSYVASNPILDLFVPSAYASVGEIKMCFKRLRFKIDQQATEDKTNSSDNIDFQIGEVTVSAGGSTLGTVLPPEAVYKRVEFDLEDGCDSGHSLSVTNSNGTFTAHQSITLKFDGSFTADGSAQALTLALDEIKTALENYNGSGQLKDAVEDADGRF